MSDSSSRSLGVEYFGLQNLSQTHRTALLYIRKSEAVSRAQLATFCGVSAPAITKVAKELLSRGLIREAGRGSNTRGQPAIQLSIDPLGAYSLGLQIERDVCSFILIDFSGKAVIEERYSGVFTSPKDALPMIFHYLNDILQSNAEYTKKLVGIGVAINGNFIIDRHKILPRIEMTEWQDIDIHDVFLQQYHLPIYVENDASAAAIGENISGHGHHYKDFFYIYMGFGLGGAYVYKSQLIRGKNGNAGELGRLSPSSAPRPSLNNMAEMLNLSLGELTKNKIEELFDNNDKQFFLWLDKAIANVNIPINAIFHLMDPEVIIISSCFPDKIATYIRENIVLDSFGDYYKSVSKPKLIQAKIPGREAITYGSATLPFNKYL